MGVFDEMFQPGVHISFKPREDFHPTEQRREYSATVTRVERGKDRMQVYVSSCGVAKDGKVVFIQELCGSVWTDGEAVWSAWVLLIDPKTGEVRQDLWGEMDVPWPVREDKLED